MSLYLVTLSRTPLNVIHYIEKRKKSLQRSLNLNNRMQNTLIKMPADLFLDYKFALF